MTLNVENCDNSFDMREGEDRVSSALILLRHQREASGKAFGNGTVVLAACETFLRSHKVQSLAERFAE
ncbi:hypothetical protein TNCV_1658811 [Trichonephila clavipes]|nr:hypothetical protein TNCV_1658811 [Trichonephila clavipes]